MNPIKMKKNRSIRQRLERAKSKEAAINAATDWAKSWENEQKMLVSRLGKAVSDDDFDSQCMVAGELKKITEKRFSGLRSVIEKLSERIEDGKSDA